VKPTANSPSAGPLQRAATFLVLSGCVFGHSSFAAPSTEQVEFFEAKVRPVLARHCYKCHSSEADKVKGDLFLDTRAGVLKGGKTGPAIVPGQPDKSLLITAIRYADPDLQMPPKGEKLGETDIANLVAWVQMGAPDPRVGSGTASAGKKPARPADHWSFRPVVRPAVPNVSVADGRENPIDAFIVAKLEEKNLKLSPPADKRVLLRRVSLDLTGLPPTPEETAAFVQDSSPDAFAKVVERLLASPRYGERWGRHWLDVARFSDTKGEIKRQRDTPLYPFAWTYRDYVIKSFNEDKPFDRFILEQIAADKLPSSKENATLAALGFLTLGERFQNNENDVINDRIDVVTKGFLGLTVSCARCHDHMFDPIPTEDYYSLHGIFASSSEPRVRPILGPDPTRNPNYSDYYQKRMALEKDLDALPSPMRKGDAKERRELARQRLELLNRVDALDLTHPGAPPRANVLVDSPRPKDSPVFIRGEAENKGRIVPRQFLECLAGPSRKPFSSGSGRFELGLAIASKSNPLTARVMVNRIWQHHFGEGLVATPDDFGAMGAAPTHPELLDYLASEFVKNGWSIKKMHRLILSSAVYQQSSENNARSALADPFNKLLWRQNIRRLEFEAMRDSLLAIGGRLDTNMFGPPVPLASTATGRGRRITTVLTPSGDARDVGYTTRRTVYGYIDRADLPEVFNHFDFATPEMSTGLRHQTTVPQQALYLMNSPLVVEQARNVVERPDVKACRDDEARVRRLYEIIYQRLPQAEEVQLGLQFVQEAMTPEDNASVVAASAPLRPGRGKVQMQNRREAMAVARKAGVRDMKPLSAWAEYAHALLMANEAAFVN
jgi:hypothetical protein